MFITNHKTHGIAIKKQISDKLSVHPQVQVLHSDYHLHVHVSYTNCRRDLSQLGVAGRLWNRFEFSDCNGKTLQTMHILEMASVTSFSGLIFEM